MSSSGLAQQIQELHQAYKERLPARLAGLEFAWDACCHNHSPSHVTSMLGLVHELKGSGATFGYPLISQIATELEVVLEDIFREAGPISHQRKTSVQWYIDQLVEAAAPTGLNRKDDAYLVSLEHSFTESSTIPFDLPAITHWSFDGFESPSPLTAHQEVANTSNLASTSHLAITMNDDEDWDEDTVLQLRTLRVERPAFPAQLEDEGDTVKMESLAREPGTRLEILVVDDDPLFARYLSLQLEQAGFASEVCLDAPSARLFLRKRRPFAIVLDVQMPESSGFVLCKEFRQHPELRHTPILFLTATEHEADMLHAYELGATDYLIKSMGTSVLLAKLKRLAAEQKPDSHVNLQQLGPGIVFADKFALVELLGKGGMGIVYRVRHQTYGTELALKLHQRSPHQQSSETERFHQEIEALGRLEHPNVIRLYEAGSKGDIFYFTMDYLAGGSLAQMLKREGALTPRQALLLIAQIAEGLQCVHQKGILHRDLKPENILLTATGVPVISDFGVVLNLREDTRRLTQAGRIVGTMHYMAPEQILTPHNIGPAIDIYALGVLLFKMLTGTEPFATSSPQAAMLLCISGQVPMLRQLNPEIPAPVEAFCLHAMANQIAQRIPSAEALAFQARALRETLPPDEDTLDQATTSP